MEIHESCQDAYIISQVGISLHLALNLFIKTEQMHTYIFNHNNIFLIFNKKFPCVCDNSKMDQYIFFQTWYTC